MDDVLAAADAGCMATYILKQGGVLEPRSNHLIRTAYIESETPNDYGELGTKIYGVWAPSLGDESRICTHADNWKMVRKTGSDDSQTKASEAAAGVDLGFDFAVGAGGIGPWTRGNKCPHPADEAPKQRKKRTTPAPDLSDFNKISFTQRREMRERLRKLPPPRLGGDDEDVKPRTQPANAPIPSAEMCQKIDQAAQRSGWILEKRQISTLARGGNVTFPNKMTVRVDIL